MQGPIVFRSSIEYNIEQPIDKHADMRAHKTELCSEDPGLRSGKISRFP